MPQHTRRLHNSASTCWGVDADGQPLISQSMANRTSEKFMKLENFKGRRWHHILMPYKINQIGRKDFYINCMHTAIYLHIFPRTYEVERRSINSFLCKLTSEFRLC